MMLRLMEFPTYMPRLLSFTSQTDRIIDSASWLAHRLLLVISCAIISFLMFKICSIQFRVGGMLAPNAIAYVPSVSYPNPISYGCTVICTVVYSNGIANTFTKLTANFSAFCSANDFAFRESN
jgi:hypothetical protein